MPPWQKIQHAPPTDELRPFSKLLSPEWTAAATGYVRDMSTLSEFKKKHLKGGGKTEE